MLVRRDEILAEKGLRATVGDNQFSLGRPEFGPPSKTTADIAKEIGLSKSTTKARKQVATKIASEVRDMIRGTALTEMAMSL